MNEKGSSSADLIISTSTISSKKLGPTTYYEDPWLSCVWLFSAPFSIFKTKTMTFEMYNGIKPSY